MSEGIVCAKTWGDVPIWLAAVGAVAASVIYYLLRGYGRSKGLPFLSSRTKRRVSFRRTAVNSRLLVPQNDKYGSPIIGGRLLRHASLLSMPGLHWCEATVLRIFGRSLSECGVFRRFAGRWKLCLWLETARKPCGQAQVWIVVECCTKAAEYAALQGASRTEGCSL